MVDVLTHSSNQRRARRCRAKGPEGTGFAALIMVLPMPPPALVPSALLDERLEDWLAAVGCSVACISEGGILGGRARAGVRTAKGAD